MKKSELLEFFNGYEIQVRDEIALIKNGKAFANGTEIEVTEADLKEALRIEGAKA